jgi:hypothetical protein
MLKKTILLLNTHNMPTKKKTTRKTPRKSVAAKKRTSGLTAYRTKVKRATKTIDARIKKALSTITKLKKDKAKKVKLVQKSLKKKR